MKKSDSKAKSSRIEDYAFVSDTQSGALISRNGCVDWLCLPRFDSGACFAALLGTRDKRPLELFTEGQGNWNQPPLSGRLADSRDGIPD